MSQISLNLAFNLFSKIFVAALSIICIPKFLHILGAENYGFISFFILINNFLIIFDFGLGEALQREIAIHATNKEKAFYLKNLVYTTEILYWATGLVFAILIAISSNWISASWLKPTAFSTADSQIGVYLFALSLFFSWPFPIYLNGLIGLHKQVITSSILIIFSLVRNIGAFFLLLIHNQSISDFFIAQIIAGALQTFLGFLFLRKHLPKCVEQPYFDLRALKAISGLASNIFLAGALSVFLIHLDKIVLSKMATLDEYAYYSLITSAATGLYFVIYPVYNTFFPKLSELASRRDESKLTQTYHQAAQLMSLLLIPLAVFLFVFAPEALFVWTKNPKIVELTATAFRLLLLGTASFGLMQVPHALQLANGCARIAVWQNVTKIILFVPLTVWLVSLFGMLGASLTWLLQNLLFLIIILPLIHKKFLKGQTSEWYIKDVGLPAIVALGSAISFKYLKGFIGNSIPIIPFFVIALLFIYLSTLIACSHIRPKILKFISSR